MSRDGIPALTSYVHMLVKVVACRDAFKTAWTTLYDSLGKRLYDRETRDPIASIMEVVKKLAAGEGSRLELFSEAGTLATRSKLGVKYIGIGPYRR